MRSLVRAVLLATICCSFALAQRSHFHWLVDAGGAASGGNTRFFAGLTGGGAIAIGRGFAAGPELGFVAPKTGRFWDTAQGLAALSGYYHFRQDNRVRFDPFAASGYSVLFRDGHTNMFHYGGGLNYWIRPDLGFRGEFRDRVGGGMHLWTFRFGVSFTGLFP